MRKFVIKNRQKRKYTKKPQTAPSFSFSKTLFGMTPILIIIIAFTATLIISASFRNTFSHIQISFQLPHFQSPHVQVPQISFANPFPFVQTISLDTLKTGTYAITIIIATAGSLYENIASLIVRDYGNFSTYLIFEIPRLFAIGFLAAKEFLFLGTVVNPMPLFFSGDTLLITCIITAGSLLLSFGEVVGYSLGLFLANFSHALVSLGITLQSTLGAIVTTITRFFLAATQATTNTFSLLVINSFRLLISFLTVCGTTIVSVLNTILQIIIYLNTMIWGVLISIVSIAAAAFIYAFTAVVHVVEIPFKILNTFWLAIKPYVDIFLRHLQMTGNDFSGGVTSLNNAIYTVSSSK